MGRSPRAGESDWFKAMFESSADAMFRCRADGRILAVNRAFERITGYPSRELLKKRIQDITSRRFLALCMRQLRSLAAGNPSCSFEKAYRRKNGRLVPVRVTGFGVRGRNGRVVDYAAVVRDIGKFQKREELLRRKVAAREAALREALSLSNSALESTADGLLVVDRTGRIRSFNRRFLEMWRFPRRLAEAGDDDRALAFVVDQLKAPELFLKRVKQLYSRPHEESFDTIEFKDGRIFERYSCPQKLGAKIVGRVWSFRDVTLARRLEKEIAEISGREQARIGRDLHDSIGQTMTAISLLAKAAAAQGDGQAKRLNELSQAALRQIRILARGLLPPELEAGDLSRPLVALARDVRELFGISCGVSMRGDARLTDRGAAVELFRIAQEAVNNAAKHARARKIRIALTADSKRIRLAISDDGAGLSAGTKHGPGLGLKIMRHRARILGGGLTIGPAGRRGTRVICECPQASRGTGS